MVVPRPQQRAGIRVACQDLPDHLNTMC
jgi:hypothetical protein